METAADKVLTAAQVLIADRTTGCGDAAVELDRDIVATICGYSSAKKCGWIFDYLESIGFLVIEHHYARPGRGRQVDTFVTFDEAPLNYIGPRSYAELVRALRDPEPVATILFEADELSDICRSDRRCPNGNLHEGSRYPNGNLDRISAGQIEGAQTGTFTKDLGTQTGTLIGISAGQIEGAQTGTFTSDRIDPFPTGKGKDRSIEPVPGGPAKPPAPGDPDTTTPAVREIARRLPWRQWAKHRATDYRPTAADIDRIAAAIGHAITTAAITPVQAATIGANALAQARSVKPASYVEDAFVKPKYLAQRLRELDFEALPDDEMPLPVTELAPASGAYTPSPKPVRRLPACSTCRAQEGDPVSARELRATANPDEDVPCPVCIPSDEKTRSAKVV